MKYEIWQVKEAFVEDVAFKSLDDLEYEGENEGLGFRKEHYEKVYEGEYELKGNQRVEVVLEELFKMFNVHRPRDFKGRSLSVSDVVVIKNRAFYCDRVGWKEVDFENLSWEKIHSDEEADEIEKLYEEVE